MTDGLHQSRRAPDRLRHIFVRAIETSDFDRRLQLVEADCSDHPGASAGMNGAGPNGYYYNP